MQEITLKIQIGERNKKDFNLHLFFDKPLEPSGPLVFVKRIFGFLRRFYKEKAVPCVLQKQDSSIILSSLALNDSRIISKEPALTGKDISFVLDSKTKKETDRFTKKTLHLIEKVLPEEASRNVLLSICRIYRTASDSGELKDLSVYSFPSQNGNAYLFSYRIHTDIGPTPAQEIKHFDLVQQGQEYDLGTDKGLWGAKNLCYLETPKQ